MPVLELTLPSERLKDETGTWGRLPPSAYCAEGRAREERPRQAVVKRLVHARVAGHEKHGVIPRASRVGGTVGDGVLPIGHDRGQSDGLVERDRIRVGRRVVGLAEDGVRQVVDVAGDVDPGRRDIGRRGDRVGQEVHPLLGDGVDRVAATAGICGDRLDLRAVQAGGDLDPVVACAAAAAVLGDVDLTGRRTDVNKVVEVADARRGVGVGRAVGQGEAVVAGAAEDRRFADLKPGLATIRGRKDCAAYSS